jgi:hypothetical protein
MHRVSRYTPSIGNLVPLMSDTANYRPLIDLRPACLAYLAEMILCVAPVSIRALQS